MILNIVSTFSFCILYCRKCEGVSKFEGYKRTSCFPFLEALVPDILCYKVSIFIIIYCSFSLKIKVFSTATIVFFNNSLHTYYNYNIIFLMCNIRRLFRYFWSLNTHLLLDLFKRYLFVKAKRVYQFEHYLICLKLMLCEHPTVFFCWEVAVL